MRDNHGEPGGSPSTSFRTGSAESRTRRPSIPDCIRAISIPHIYCGELLECDLSAGAQAFSLPRREQRSKEAAGAAPLRTMGAGQDARKRRKEEKFNAGEKHGGQLPFVQAAVG